MPPPPTRTWPPLWTQQQRGVLIALLFALIAIFAIRLIHDNQTVPADLPEIGPRANELLTQLDLNTATAAQLSAIPRLGIAKAHAIIAYREQFVSSHPGQRAFDRIEDLFRIKGIGVSTLEQLRQYTFIANAPATRSSQK